MKNRESFVERDTRTPAYADGPCMSLVHLTEMKGDRNSDTEINRLSAGSNKTEAGGRERERERVILVRGTNNALIQASYTRAHY